LIHQELQGDVAILRIEHGKANAIDSELCSEIISSLESVESSAATGVVLTGSGSIFSAGVDLFKVLEAGQDYTNNFLELLHEAFMKVFTFPKPLIAAINGHAIAGGCIIVQACDYRLMSEGKGTIGVPERVVGVPFPTAALEVLRFAVPPQHLQELVYRGMTYDVNNAHQRGLIDEVVGPSELIEKSVELAKQFGRAAADTFAMTKSQLRKPVLERIEARRQEDDARATTIWTSPEAQLAIREFLAKRIGKSA